MENQTPDQTQHPDPNEATSEEAARRSGLRRLFKRRPVMAGSAMGAIGMALALAVAGVMSAGAQSSDDDPSATVQTAASTDDDSRHSNEDSDNDDDSEGDGSDDDSDGLRGFLRRFRAPSAEDRAAFESFKTCLTDAGVEGLEHDKDGVEVSVTGPDGFSIVRLGDGSVTVTRSGDDMTITTTGDATVMDIKDLKTAWQTEAAVWQSAFESCKDRLPEGFRDWGKWLGEYDFEDFDKAEILEELGIETEDLVDIGDEFAGIGERYAEEFAGIGEHFEEFFANKGGWW